MVEGTSKSRLFNSMQILFSHSGDTTTKTQFQSEGNYFRNKRKAFNGIELLKFSFDEKGFTAVYIIIPFSTFYYSNMSYFN